MAKLKKLPKPDGPPAFEIVKVKGKKKAVIPAAKKIIIRGQAPIVYTYTPGCIGHATRRLPPLPPNPPNTLVVQDFLVDSSGLSKGGESVDAINQVGLNASRRIEFRIKPEHCKKGFKVSRPAGITRGYFSFTFGRQALHPSGIGGFYDIYPAVVRFNNLAGTAPTLTYSNFFITNGTNNSFYVYITGEFTNDFAFTDIEIICRYQPRNFLPKFDFYKLLAYADPITIASDEDKNYALFGYSNANGEDLGPIIYLTD